MRSLHLLIGVTAAGFAVTGVCAQTQPGQGAADDPFLALPELGDRPSQVEGMLTLPSSDGGQDPLVARERMSRRSAAEARPRGSTVLQRGRPDYDPVGVKAGSFTLFPSLTLSAGGRTNVRGSGDGDVFGTVRAAGVLRSDWSRHQLVLDGYIDRRQFASFEDESSTNWLGRARGRLNIHGRDTITAELSSERVVQERGAIGELVRTRQPASFQRDSARVEGTFHSGRFAATLQGGYSDRNYDDISIEEGQPLDQGYRDHETYEAGIDLGYQFGAPRNLFVSAFKTWTRYRLDSMPSRDVDTLELLAGIRSEITPLIRGQFAIGYLRANFKDPAVSTRDGIAIDTRLEYLMTELTTFSLRARRYVRSIQSVRSPGAVATTFRLGVDHELLRNLILSGAVRHERANYVDSPRKDRLTGLEAGATWFLNRKMRASLRGNAYRRKSYNLEIEDDRDFKAATITAGITFQL